MLRRHLQVANNLFAGELCNNRVLFGLSKQNAGQLEAWALLQSTFTALLLRALQKIILFVTPCLS